MGFIYQYILYLRLKLRKMEYTSTKSEKDKEYLSIVIKIVFDFRDPRPHFENYYSNAINTPHYFTRFLFWPFLLSGKFFPISAYKNPSKLKCLTLLVRSSPRFPHPHCG